MTGLRAGLLLADQFSRAVLNPKRILNAALEIHVWGLERGKKFDRLFFMRSGVGMMNFDLSHVFNSLDMTQEELSAVLEVDDNTLRKRLKSNEPCEPLWRFAFIGVYMSRMIHNFKDVTGELSSKKVKEEYNLHKCCGALGLGPDKVAEALGVNKVRMRRQFNACVPKKIWFYAVLGLSSTQGQVSLKQIHDVVSNL